MTVRHLGICIAVFATLGTSVCAQNTQLLGTARTLVLKSDVIYHKDRKADSKPVPFSYIYEAGLLKKFREVSSSPDIIIRTHKDVFIIGEEKVSLTAFDPEDNSVIYTEERNLLDEENDVNKLVAHLLARVTTERKAIAQVAAEAKQEQAHQVEVDAGLSATGKKALDDANNVLKLYTESESLREAIIKANRNNPNEYHVYLQGMDDPTQADVLLERHVEAGIYTLTLRARDTKEVLHTESASEKSRSRAISSMSKWITSTAWE
jgi:hypothetical protein